MNNEFEEKLKVLRRGYINKLKDNFDSFKSLSSEKPLNFGEIYSRVHTISGTCGMYGLKDLSDISTGFEIYLKPLKENSTLIKEDELRANFKNYLEVLESILKSGV